MWKKLICLNLALILLFGILPVSAAAATDPEDNGYAVFYKNDGTDTYEKHIVDVFTSNGSLELYYDMPLFDGEGQTVVSFNSKKDGTGTEYTFSTKLHSIYSDDAANPTVLYAQWEDAPGYHVRYISTDGLTKDGKDYYVDSNLTGTITLPGEDLFIPQKKYQKVVAWSTSPTAAPEYFPEDKIDLSDNLTLYSVVGVCCITFHYQKYDQKADAYEAVARVNSFPSPDSALNPHLGLDTGNRIFIGWNSEEDGSGDWYTNGDLAIDAPEHLYAQYEDLPKTPYYILDGGSCGLSNGKQKRILPLSEDYEIFLPKYLNNGRYAAYWELDGKLYYPGGASVLLQESGQVITAIPADVERYYCAVVDGVDGTTTYGSRYSAQRFYRADSATLFSMLEPFTAPEDALCGFEGSKTGTVYSFNDNLWTALEAEADRNGIAHFTAQYLSTAGPYVQYIGNGAKTLTGADYLIQDNMPAKYSENPFETPNGLHFLGWNTEEHGYGTWYDPGENIKSRKNTVLYAIWGAWRVAYHYESANGAAITRNDFRSESGQGTIDRSMDDTDSALFAGWNTAADGSGTQYVNGALIPVGTVLHLYDSWVTLPTTGYYYALKSSKLDSGNMAEIVPMAAKTETITLPTSTTAAPNRTKLGWYVDGEPVQAKGFLDETDTIYAPGSTLKVSSTTQLNAADAYACIEYHKNGGGEENPRVYYTLTSYSSLKLYSAESVFADIPDNSVFAGWNTKADGTGTHYREGDRLYNGSYTLYAQWISTDAVETVPMYRMYDPNSGEHFYTGSEKERENLIDVGWNYEGVGFNFPVIGNPVHRLYNPFSGDHLYTMDEAEKEKLLARGWNYEGVAFNSASADQIPQYRLWNPNATRGAWHFTGSEEERDWLISLGWQYQGIGWYSTMK